MSLPLATDGANTTRLAESAVSRGRLSRRVLIDALFVGTLADALLRNGFGLGLLLWMVAFAVMLHHLVRQRGARLTREQSGWLAASIFFAATFTWRDSPSLRPYDFLAMVAALALLGATLSHASPIRSILGQRVRDVALAVAQVAKDGVASMMYLVFRDSGLGTLAPNWRSGRSRAALRATLIALPLILVFAALFSVADPLFGSLLSVPNADLGEIASHLVVIGAYAWIVGGWLRGAIVAEGKPSIRTTRPFLSLGTLEVTIILGALVALFALFVSVQIGWLFGGERLIRSTTGLSYAEYARHGFFELVWVAVLVLPVLLGTRASLADGDIEAERRHRFLAMPLLALLAGVLASALGRMGLYVHYYGLSTDRLFASVFIGWLAFVFTWFCLTVLRGRPRDFVAGMTISGFFTLAGLNAVYPEAWVARVNIDRARTAVTVADSVTSDGSVSKRVISPIDYSYLTKPLGGDAVAHVVEALFAPPSIPPNNAARREEVRERCNAVKVLLLRWGSTGQRQEQAAGTLERAADWRLWNVGAWRARDAVRAHEAALRAVTCWDASGETPFGDRERRPAAVGDQWYRVPQQP